MPAASKSLPENEAHVLVIDDDSRVRNALRMLLCSVGLRATTFASTEEFLANPIPDAPSCLVLDVRLRGVSGLDFQAELAKANIRVPIVFITGHGDIPMTVQAMKAGAVEFLTKPFRDQDLLDAVQLGLDRDRLRREAEKAMSSVVTAYRSLTEREQQVLPLVTSGQMNKQVAFDLGVSEITIKVHRANIMRKMGATSLADLVRMADILGLRN